MDLKYLRYRIFQGLKAPFSQRARHKRMLEFVETLSIREGMSVLDLGGDVKIWDSVPQKLNITILNLPGGVVRRDTHHNVRYVEGDACNVVGLDDETYDLVFSNSVIEHVGNAGKRAEFAREVRRFAPIYWVQTPSIYFPIEAHCGMPFWWFYPERARKFFIERWRTKLPEWTVMVEETDIVLKSELAHLFPGATIKTERVLGIPKSYVAVARGGRRPERIASAQGANAAET